MECVYFKGVKQPDGTEKTEYVRCEAAETKDAKDILTISKGKIICGKKTEP
jgi:hypothetical protein